MTSIQLTLFDTAVAIDSSDKNAVATNAMVGNASVTTVTGDTVSPTTNAAVTNDNMVPVTNMGGVMAAINDDNIVGVEPPKLQGVPYSQYLQARRRESELGLENECPF